MNKVKLIAVKDICLNPKNNQHPFTRVEEIFREKDILFGNLETALSDKGTEAEKAVLHYASQQKIQYLKDAHYDVVSVANNHVMDLGIQGLNNTLDVLSEAEISFIGVSNHKYH